MAEQLRRVHHYYNYSSVHSYDHGPYTRALLLTPMITAVNTSVKVMPLFTGRDHGWCVRSLTRKHCSNCKKAKEGFCGRKLYSGVIGIVKPL